MMNYKTVLFCLLAFSISSCSEETKEQKTTESKEVENKTILQKVDQLNAKLTSTASELSLVASLDHHRMAKEEGVYTPPAIAGIYSDAKINSEILSKTDPLVGLDLPFKFLSYSEADTTKAMLAYTSSEFIAKRHTLSEEILSSFQNKISTIVKTFDSSIVSESNLDSVSKDYGIVSIPSDFGFEATVEKVKAIVMAQSDTRWFAEIDYQNEAKNLNIDLKPNTLLLFGGPAPGGKAMMTTPKIGLDAFCQKLLVYEKSNGEVWIAYNDIVAFAELYYQTFTKPQQMINQRLKMTFSKAVSKPER